MHTELKKTFGSRLSRARKRKDLTQTQLANLLFLSPRTIRGYEYGEREPSIEILKEICRILCVSLDYLLGASEEYQPGTPKINYIGKETYVVFVGPNGEREEYQIK